MKLIIRNTRTLNGEAVLPGSKSQSIRAIILSSLCEGESVLQNILYSEDTRDAIQACRQLGAKISESETILTIQGNGLPLSTQNNKIHTGNSGITTHFIMPLLGLRKNADIPIILDCHDQMRARPVQSLIESLTHLGMHIRCLTNANALPISVTGKLLGGKTHVSGVTSQYLSALLLALPCAEKESEVTVHNLTERPYVEMTLDYLKQQNIEYHHTASSAMDTYQIKGQQKYKSMHITIGGDFSSASYIIAAAVLIPGQVILNGLSMSDNQGDKHLVTLLQAMGATIRIEPTHLIIHGNAKLTGITIDVNAIPDLLPILAVIGTCASGKTILYNAAHTRIKETDRIHSMQEGLTRMGAKIEETADGLIVHQSALHGCPVHGYADHRTVMALSVAAMIATGETVIDDGEAINKTFPTFVNTMRSLGATMEIVDATTT